MKAFCVKDYDARPYHPKFRRQQGGVLHSSIVSQDAVGTPAEQQRLQRIAGVELQSEKEKRQEQERFVK